MASNLEHGRVDVRNSDVDVGVAVVDVRVVQHAKGDVASAARDIENLLGLSHGIRRARIQGGDKIVPLQALACGQSSDGLLGNVLPQTMYPQGHEVVHLVVGLGDIGKHPGDSALFLGLVDGLVSKVRFAVAVRRFGRVEAGSRDAELARRDTASPHGSTQSAGAAPQDRSRSHDYGKSSRLGTLAD